MVSYDPDRRRKTPKFHPSRRYGEGSADELIDEIICAERVKQKVMATLGFQSAEFLSF